MSDTKHAPATAPVEGDGVNYRGIFWFLIILVATTVFCQLLVWGMFDAMAWRARTTDTPRAALAATPAAPDIQNGRLVSGTDTPPQPNLNVSEPTVLHDFRKSEDEVLTTYGWMDQANGVVRIPVDRAKELILQRGLPTRPAGAAAGAAAPSTKAPANTKSAPAAAKNNTVH